MELSYGITLEQKQQLSQGQIQSLEVLAMDSMELNQFLQNEYLENPLLDYSGDHGTGSVEINKTYEQTAPFEKNYEEMVEEEDRRRKDIPMQDADHVKNYILYQLPRNMYNARQWNLLEYMVECLDDTGFFTTPLKEVAEKDRHERTGGGSGTENIAGAGALWHFCSGSPPLSDETAGDAGRPEFHSIPDRGGASAGCGGRKDQQYFQKHEAFYCRSTEMY